MKAISLEPDDDMKWIYDPSHPDYYSDRAKSLRDRRSDAMRNAPEWMIREAELNDSRKKWDAAIVPDAYQRGRDDGLREAAKVCEELHIKLRVESPSPRMQCSAAIRALIGKPAAKDCL